MKNILLIGTGRFGRHIAVQLSQLGHQVMAVDTNEERISDVLPYGQYILGKPANGLGNRAIYQPAAS